MYIKNKYNQKLFTDTLYIPHFTRQRNRDVWQMTNVYFRPKPEENTGINRDSKVGCGFFFKIWLNTVDKYKFH